MQDGFQKSTNRKYMPKIKKCDLYEKEYNFLQSTDEYLCVHRKNLSILATIMIDNTPFYKHEKTAIFIDGANLYSAARALDFDIDYKLLLEFIASNGRLMRSFYYTAVIDDQEYSPIRPLVDWLDYNGYCMVTKPAKEFIDAYGRKKLKGNMDIELTVDMMEVANHADHIILFSGDGDFRRLIEAVQRKGARVTVVSTLKSSPPMISDDLRRQADHFLDLDNLAPYIQRDGNITSKRNDDYAEYEAEKETV